MTRTSIYKKILATLLLLCATIMLFLPIGNKTEASASPGFTNWIDIADTSWYDVPNASVPIGPENLTGSVSVVHQYYINSAEQLAGLARLVNNGTATFEGKIIYLTSNIYLADKQWTPIGTVARPFLGTFSGMYDDKVYAIYDLRIDPSATQNIHIGLFGVVGRPDAPSMPNRYDHPAIVEHVRLVDPFVYVTTGPPTVPTYSVGGVVGRNYGSILYSSVIARRTMQEVSGQNSRGVGGICGENYGIIQECYNEGQVTGFDGNSLSGAGGIVGDNRYGGVVENCYNTGTINSTRKSVGGIVGYNYEGGLINRVYNIGEITISGVDTGFGGICGTNDGKIDYAAYWYGDKDQRLGGQPIDEGSTSMRKQGVGGGIGTYNGVNRINGTAINNLSSYPGFIFTPTAPDTWSFVTSPGPDDYPMLVNVPEIPDTTINTINIYLTPPRTSEPPSIAVTSNTKGIEVVDVNWLGVVGNSFAATNYTVEVTINAKSLFVFNTALTSSTVYINGASATVVSNTADTVVLSRSYVTGSGDLAIPQNRQPANRTLMENTGTIISVEHSTTSLHDVYYQWYRNDDGIPIPIGGPILNNYSLPITAASLPLSGSPYIYYCEISQLAPNEIIQSREVIITVLPYQVSGQFLDPWDRNFSFATYASNPWAWDFSSATYGYEAQRPRNIRASNTTRTIVPTLTYVITGDDQMFERPVPPSLWGIPRGGNTSFTIAPALGLPVGRYFATVTLVEISKSINLSFEVLPKIQDTPKIQIDYIEEKLIGFNPDETYTISISGVPIVGFANFTGISEIDLFDLIGAWTTDIDLEIVMKGETVIFPAIANIWDSAAQLLTIPKRPAPPTGLTGIMPDRIAGKDGKILGTTDQMEYSLDPPGADTWIACTNVETLNVIPDDNYHVRYRANPDPDGNFRSLSATPLLKVPQRPGPLEATPSSLINYEKETLYNLVPTAEYMINGEAVVFNADGEVDIKEAWFDTTIELIKVGTGNWQTTGDSHPQMVWIKARQATPLATDVIGVPPATIAGTIGEITGMEAGMEFKSKDEDLEVIIDGGSPILADDWMDYIDPSMVEGEIGPYLVRRKASNTLSIFASLPLEVAIPRQDGSPEPTPLAMIDFINERLINLDFGAAYRINYASQSLIASGVAGSGWLAINEAWMGTQISIIKRGDGSTSIDSDSQFLRIPARPAAPNITAEAPSVYAGLGQLLSTDTTMEYKLSSGPDVWTVCQFPETDLLPGDYEVRIRAVGGINGNFKSNPTLITIPEWTADPEPTPEVIIDYIEEKLTNFEDTASYTIKINDVEQLVGGSTVFTNLTELVIDPTWMDEIIHIIRKGDGVLTRDSDPQILSLERPEAPTNLVGVPPTSAGMSARISGTTGAMEYRAYVDPQPSPPIPWVTCSNQTTFVGPPGTYEVRIRAVAGPNGNFAGKSAHVTVTDITVPPESITFEAVQVGGASGVADSTGIEITFNRSITGLGLTADDIVIVNDTGAVVKGSLSGSGRVYTIALSNVVAEGDVHVSIKNLGAFTVTGLPSNPVHVRVYKNTSGMSIVVGAQNGLLRTGIAGSVRYTVTTTGIPVGSAISLMNLNSVTGITMDTAVTVGNTTYITIRTTATTPPGTHPLRLSIYGIRSNVFHLVIDPSQGVTPPLTTYTVTVTGSAATSTGAGIYSPGEAVSISAGIRDGYSFSGWTASGGVAGGLEFEDPNSPTTIFLMPNGNVTVTANWGVAITDHVIYTAEQIGGVSGNLNSTAIRLVFDRPVTGLTASHINITNGSGSATKGTLSGSGNTYTLALTNVTTQGTVSISIANFGSYAVSNNPQIVQVFRDASGRRIQVGAQNGYLEEGTFGYVTYTVTTENIANGSFIQLNNLDNHPGITLDSAYTTGNSTIITIRTTNGTLRGQHPLSLTINGLTSNNFELTVGRPGSSGTASTYTVSISGSYASGTGSGRYSPGSLVTVQAGTRANYSFNGWTSSSSVSFADQYNPSGVFVMPSFDVSLTVNWQATSQEVTFTANEIGGSSGNTNSTGIRLNFSQWVTGLTAGHITITNSRGAVVKGELTGSGNTYTIALSNVTAEGTVNVSIANFGIYEVTNTARQVTVYWNNTNRRLTMGSQNGTLASGTWGEATFNATTTNIPTGSTISLDNINYVSGITLNTTQTSGNSTSVAISISSSTPIGAHPLRLIIGDVSSDVFYLAVGSQSQSTTGTYTLTISGSYAAQTGAGRYSPGQIVTVHAGSRSNYTFSGWTSSSGVSLANRNNATTTFVMPSHNVTITATWNISGSTGGVGGGTGSGVGSGSAYGSSPWATSMIELAIATGLVPTQLRSNYTADITRAEFSALVVTLYETLNAREITERAEFSDTSDVYVQKAAAMGFVNGVGGNRFNPDGLLTREEAAVIIVRLATELGWDLPQRDMLFADHSQISIWALTAVGQVHAAGIMSGVAENTFAPKSQVTREQSIVLIFRMYDGRRSY